MRSKTSYQPWGRLLFGHTLPRRMSAHALRFRGRKRVHDADPLGAQLVAERLIEALRMSGFVVMKKPEAGMMTWPPRERR